MPRNPRNRKAQPKPPAALDLAGMRSLARSYAGLSVRTLAGIVASQASSDAARVAAANSLLDRGFGKPEQVHSGEISGEIQVIIRALGSNAPATIDVSPNPLQLSSSDDD